VRENIAEPCHRLCRSMSPSSAGASAQPRPVSRGLPARRRGPLFLPLRGHADICCAGSTLPPAWRSWKGKSLQPEKDRQLKLQVEANPAPVAPVPNAGRPSCVIQFRSRAGSGPRGHHRTEGRVGKED